MWAIAAASDSRLASLIIVAVRSSSSSMNSTRSRRRAVSAIRAAVVGAGFTQIRPTWTRLKYSEISAASLAAQSPKGSLGQNASNAGPAIFDGYRVPWFRGPDTRNQMNLHLIASPAKSEDTASRWCTRPNDAMTRHMIMDRHGEWKSGADHVRKNNAAPCGAMTLKRAMAQVHQCVRLG